MRVPQSYMIYKEEIKKAKKEKSKLKEKYDEKIEKLSLELSNLKEQIAGQQSMIESVVKYASKLEDQLTSFNKQLTEDEKRNENGFH